MSLAAEKRFQNNSTHLGEDVEDNLLQNTSTSPQELKLCLIILEAGDVEGGITSEKLPDIFVSRKAIN